MEERKELDIGISKYAREKVIDHLKFGFSHDFLEEDAFEKRIKIAVNTQNKHDLNALVDDLPEMKEVQKTGQGNTSQVHINTGHVKANDNIVCVLAGVDRKGGWKPAKKTDIFNVLGGTVLDYTRAELPPGITEINVVSIMGGVEVFVPPGVNVDNHCIAVLGGVDNRIVQSDDPNCPTIKITGVVVLGGLDITTPKNSLMKRILKKLGIDE